MKVQLHADSLAPLSLNHTGKTVQGNQFEGTLNILSKYGPQLEQCYQKLESGNTLITTTGWVSCRSYTFKIGMFSGCLKEIKKIIRTHKECKT